MNILVTGGSGYIGSHTVIELLESGYNVIIVDNLSNSKIQVVDRIKQITNIYDNRIMFYKSDIRDRASLNNIFSTHSIDAVIHFAGFKAVGESVSMPIEYYDNNIYGTLVLLDVMKKNNVKKIVFSSSATVYGIPHLVPITEDFPLSTTNPYGTTKLYIEQILQDVYTSDNSWSICILRYFNPIGAHSSGLIGEDPNGIPNNLLPYISQVAIGKLPHVNVFGNDYNTHDGTGVRDYIHVVDLAIGHIKAIEYLKKFVGVEIINLGTGHGYSVLDMIKSFSKASGKELPYIVKERRAGDVAECYADPTKALQLLGWKATKTIDDMCNDTWNWQTKNPNGFEG